VLLIVDLFISLAYFWLLLDSLGAMERSVLLLEIASYLVFPPGEGSILVLSDLVELLDSVELVLAVVELLKDLNEGLLLEGRLLGGD